MRGVFWQAPLHIHTLICAYSRVHFVVTRFNVFCLMRFCRACLALIMQCLIRSLICKSVFYRRTDTIAQLATFLNKMTKHMKYHCYAMTRIAFEIAGRMQINKQYGRRETEEHADNKRAMITNNIRVFRGRTRVERTIEGH